MKTQIITTVLSRTAEGITCIAMMMDSFTAIIADDVDDVLVERIIHTMVLKIIYSEIADLGLEQPRRKLARQTRFADPFCARLID